MNTKVLVLSSLISFFAISSFGQSAAPVNMSITLERTEAGKAIYESNPYIGRNSTATCFASTDLYSQDEKGEWKRQSRDVQKRIVAPFQFSMNPKDAKEGDAAVVQVFCYIVDGTLIGAYKDLSGVSRLKLNLENANGTPLDSLDLDKEKSIFNYKIDLVMKNGAFQKMSGSYYRFLPAH